MKDNTPLLGARGKLFAVAPMMDGEDNLDKSIGYRASCAKRVQYGSVASVKVGA
jgi:hypothetical protein